MLEWATVHCPYCGEAFATPVDCSAGDQQYVEDCQVCCQPIVLAVAVVDGQLQHLEATPENP
ncbi:MAG: CPXCG motif-containing cysteine-rich protein [Candidatus Competibacterales bacterium]